MTPAQVLNEVRKELAINERLADLLKQVTKNLADHELRLTYQITDPSILLRQSAAAEGMERLLTEITKAPVHPRGGTAAKE